MRDKLGRFVDGNDGKRNRFTSEQMKGNQFALGNPPNSKTWKVGDTAGNKHPQWSGGVQHISKDCIYLHAGTHKRVRRPRKLWEDMYGKIPRGFMIWHKNRDRHDDRIENLECISRAECIKRNAVYRNEATI